MQFAAPLRPRPTILDLTVSAIEGSVLAWLIDRGTIIAVSEVRARLREALGFSADAYRVARFLDDRHAFPADETLVMLVRKGAADARKGLKAAVMNWVMETGVRFHGVPGDPVTFRKQGTLVYGVVQTVRHETADAIVMVVDGIDDVRGPVMTVVAAEDVARGTR